MKTLYVSDLDGTLLKQDQTLSKYTIETIQELVGKGMLFSYATARSYPSLKPVTAGLDVEIPLIVYNGSFILDNKTQEILLSNYFTSKEKEDLISIFQHFDFHPIVYAYRDGIERFSYDEVLSTKEELAFVETRHDERKNPVKDIFYGDIFYFSCIGTYEKLKSMYDIVKEKYQTIFSQDIYSHDWWLEILPQDVSKANAIKQLKELLDADEVVVFGDGKNDLSMFEIADRGYAVNNACDELKEVATEIILSNEEDGVARKLRELFHE